METWWLVAAPICGTALVSLGIVMPAKLARTAAHEIELDLVSAGERAIERGSKAAERWPAEGLDAAEPEARDRRAHTPWFQRLDADAHAPSVAERIAFVSWLAIPAPFAGKLLRNAFEEEDSAPVRARIIGALAGGEHFSDKAPFEVAFARGGIERAAVLEVLGPRAKDQTWVHALLQNADGPCRAESV